MNGWDGDSRCASGRGTCVASWWRGGVVCRAMWWCGLWDAGVGVGVGVRELCGELVGCAPAAIRNWHCTWCSRGVDQARPALAGDEPRSQTAQRGFGILCGVVGEPGEDGEGRGLAASASPPTASLSLSCSGLNSKKFPIPAGGARSSREDQGFAWRAGGAKQRRRAWGLGLQAACGAVRGGMENLQLALAAVGLVGLPCFFFFSRLPS